MKNSIFTKIISISVLIIALSIFYYFIIYVPQRDNRIMIQDQVRQEKLNECLSSAEENFSLKWNSFCSNGVGTWINICQGVEAEGCSECILSEEDSESLNEQLRIEKEECFNLYKK